MLYKPCLTLAAVAHKLSWRPLRSKRDAVLASWKCHESQSTEFELGCCDKIPYNALNSSMGVLCYPVRLCQLPPKSIHAC